MNKINPFFNELHALQQILKMYEKVAIITQIWHWAKCYLQPWAMHHTWLLYQIWTKSPHSSLRYYNKHSKNVWKNCHNYSNWYRAKFYFICISGLWYQIWRKSIQPSWRNVQRQTNRLTGPIPIFPYSTIEVTAGIGNNKHVWFYKRSH